MNMEEIINKSSMLLMKIKVYSPAKYYKHILKCISREKELCYRGVARYKVRLLPHSNEWDKEYLKTKEKIGMIWADDVLYIQHAGSTV